MYTSDRITAMPMHIDLDESLVNAALAEYVRVLKRHEPLALRGQVRWEGSLDALRERTAR